MLGELVGRGELRRSIGMVSFNFCFIPLFLLSSLHDLLLKGLYQARSLHGQRLEGVVFSVCTAESLFSLLFVYQNQETGQIAPSSQFQSFVL